MALRIIGELFQRSKVVRATLVANLEVCSSVTSPSQQDAL